MATPAGSEPPIRRPRVPDPWRVTYCTLRDVDTDALPPDDPVWGWLTEDQLQIEHPDGRLLDVGWYPDNDPAGRFRLVVERGGEVLHRAEHRSVDGVIGDVAKICGAAGAPPSATERAIRDLYARHLRGEERTTRAPTPVILGAWTGPVPAEVLDQLVTLWLQYGAFDPAPEPAERIAWAAEAVVRQGTEAQVDGLASRTVASPALADAIARVAQGLGAWTDSPGSAARAERLLAAWSEAPEPAGRRARSLLGR